MGININDTDAAKRATARRLKAIMTFLGAGAVEQFARMLGATRSQVSNWLQGYNYPRIPEMALLCTDMMKGDMTLDWIYRGEPQGVPYGVVANLESILDRIPLPAVKPKQARLTTKRPGALKARRQ